MKTKRSKSMFKFVMWIAVPSCVAAILIILTKDYDWRAAVLASIACACGVFLKTLYINEWEEDYEAQQDD